MKVNQKADDLNGYFVGISANRTKELHDQVARVFEVAVVQRVTAVKVIHRCLAYGNNEEERVAIGIMAGLVLAKFM